MRRAGHGVGKTILYLVLGLLVGNLVGTLLSHLHVPYMATFTNWVWHPAADLGVIRYDLVFNLRLNPVCLVGIAAGYWLLKRS
jgi:hypothetical protein